MGSEVLTDEGIKLYYHPSANKKYKPTVVMVHHMWGNHKTPWRHYRYLNEKGFDCVSFDLLFGSNIERFRYHPYLKYIYKGIFYVWTKQIRNVLNSIEGPKIIYSFSGPSLSALWAAQGREDIVKAICDGGPFDDIYENTKNFFHIVVGIKNPFLYSLAAWFGAFIWGYKPVDKLHKILRFWPQSVPILSIRGQSDNIVAIESIEKVFYRHSNLNLQVLELPHGGHLDGLRDFPEKYCKTMFPFIKKDLEKIR